MLALETVAGIRNDHFRDKVPIKAIARKRRVSRNTVRKAVREGPEAFGSAAGKRQPKPKLGPWIRDLERMLAERAALPRRERPTLTRIHEDLASLGCGAGYDSVRRHAAAWRERQAEEAPRETPPGLDLHLVLDTCATHKHPKVRAWLAKRRRFHLHCTHCTPTSASWLNQVERWFAAVSQRAIKRGSFDSIPHLVRTIESFIADYNETSSPFAWIATADSILGKLERLSNRICRTGH